MKLIHLSAPLAGPERRDNIARAEMWVEWAARQGVVPLAGWVTLVRHWHDTKTNRDLLLAINAASIARADCLWLVGGRITAEMEVDVATAHVHGVQITDHSRLGPCPPVEQSRMQMVLEGRPWNETTPRELAERRARLVK